MTDDTGVAFAMVVQKSKEMDVLHAKRMCSHVPTIERGMRLKCVHKG